MNHLIRKIFVPVILISLSISLFSQDKHDVDSTRLVRVLTFNIFHGEIRYQRADQLQKSNLDIVADVIRSAKPDIVALQEVDRNTVRADGLDLVVELAMRTGMAPLFGSTMDFDGGEYGLGILSCYSFRSTKMHPLYSPPDTEPRGALEANVILKSGDTIRFISTHFDHSRETLVKINQAQDINTLFASDQKPSVLAGDLNARPDSEPISILDKKWINSSRTNDPTSPSIDPRSKIDYIMFRPEVRWRIIESRVIDERVASDHNPVLTVLELLPN